MNLMRRALTSPPSCNRDSGRTHYPEDNKLYFYIAGAFSVSGREGWGGGGENRIVKAVFANASAFPNALDARYRYCRTSEISERGSHFANSQWFMSSAEDLQLARAISRAEYKRLKIGKKNDRFSLVGDYESVVVKR
jgi:hypothetical protein